VVAGGKKATSVPDAVTKLKKQKLLSTDGKGNYKITAAGNRALNKEE
jgi:Mn-dependent DtxR family transcriptional regulator